MCIGTYTDDGDQPSVGLLDLECKRDQEDSDRVECLISARLEALRRLAHLEHLDERDTETEVGVVGQNQGSRKEGTNG